MIFFDQFLRNYGVRLPSDLIKPKLRKINFFDLPKLSIVHYHDDTSISNGPPPDELYLKKVTKQIYLGNVITLASTKGNPRLAMPNPTDLITKYFQKNRRFIRLRDLRTAGRDQSTVVMYNYNMLQHIYRYMRSTYSNYFEWYNTWATVWANMNAVAKQSERSQFVIFKLPEHLPSVSNLQYGQSQGDNMSQALLKMFNSSERRIILEIWKLLGEEPETSMLNVIDKNNYGRINIAFTESGRWTFINLGLLMSWKQSTQAEVEAAKGNKELQSLLVKEGFRPVTLQKTFLRFMMSIMQARSVNTEDDDLITEIDDGDDLLEEAVGTVVNPKPVGGAPTPGSKNTTTTKVEQVPTKAGSTGKEGVNLKNPTLKNQDSLDSSPDTLLGNQRTEVTSEPDAVSEQSLDELNKDFFLAADLMKHIDDDLGQLELMPDNPEISPNEVAVSETNSVMDVVEDLPLDEAFMKVVDRMADNGVITGQDYSRLKRQSEEYKTLQIPTEIMSGVAGTMKDFVVIPPVALEITEVAKIPDLPTVVDKTMLESTLLTFDSDYISKIMQRDIAAMVLNFQKAGIAIRSYDVEKIENIAGASFVYTVKVNPIEGAPSTWTFRMPVLNSEGEYRSNDVKYNMRKQRNEIPIRKVSQERVALTSYYGKIFVDRSDKKVNDFGSWVRTQVRLKGLDKQDNSITNIHPGDVFESKFVAPRGYTIMASGFNSISVTPTYVPEGQLGESYTLNFDHTKREKLYGAEAMLKYEVNHSVLFGMSTTGKFLILDGNGTVYAAVKGSEAVPLMSIDQLLSLDMSKSPVDFVELRFLGKSVPLAVVLSYEMGLTKLMSSLSVFPRRVPVGTRVILAQNEFSVVFNDVTLVFSRDDGIASLIMAGWNEYHRSIREYDIHEFDRRGVYFNIFDRHGLTVRYLREIDLMYPLFIDPITKDLLKEMGEPTEFRPLLLRAAQLLTTDHYPEEYTRNKGYERMAGAVYSALINSVRAHAGRPNKSKQPIELNPHEIWKSITTDPSNAQVSDINPIQNLKEKEAATFSGNGGRSSRSMVKRTRLYRDSDKGVISESTVDSGSVGINVYMSANPRFRSLRGLTKTGYDPKVDGVTSLLSTSALLAPGSDRDDPKRVNFVAIQNSHGVACEGYHQMPVRTGYEGVVAHRTGDMFAATAKKNGRVISINNDGIIVEYEDGELVGVEMGRRFGDAAGLTIPHDIVTFLKVGDLIKPGTILAYNSGFFERDYLYPDNVVLKNSMLVRTVLMEAPITFEDSSAISKRVADKLVTNITKVKEIVVGFEQEVHRLVKEKQFVEAEDILCIIEDQATAASGLFNETSLDTLRALSAQAPQAKSKGTIDRIEVFYNGETEDMTDSLREIAIASDRQVIRRQRSAAKETFNGQVDDNFRVDGNPLLMDTMVIRIYITSPVTAGVGDKGVICNQMKTVIGEVMERQIVTESGVVIDAIFGQKSIDDRIVTNPAIIGTTATLLEVGAKRVIAAYRS